MRPFLVVGDANVDIILSGLPALPVLGQEMEAAGSTVLLGGSCANCAVWLAGLGADVAFWGKVGRDMFGDFVIRAMRERGVEVGKVVRDGDMPTGVCVALTYPVERALMTHPGAVATLRLDDLPVNDLHRYTHLHSGSLFIQHGLRPSLPELFKAAKEAGLSTSLDCGWDPADRWDVDLRELLAWVDIFLPNEAEALRLTGAEHPEDALEMLGQHGHTVVIKRGREGALARRDGRTYSMAARRVEQAEPTGAGDCFNAGLLYALIAEQREFRDALRFAVTCGGIAASMPGGSSMPPSADDVLRLLNEEPAPEKTYDSNEPDDETSR
jgi:sugar/nucleoside kinase (ribokinase family)